MKSKVQDNRVEICKLLISKLWTTQKYRSHRKHLLAREAEAASWSQRRQMYGGAGGGGTKINVSPWLAPTMGFPQNPMTPLQHVRPLHVWGHPPTDQPLMRMQPPPPPTAAWTSTLHSPRPARPPPDHSFWHSHRKRVITNLSMIIYNNILQSYNYRKYSTRMRVIFSQY